MQNLVRAAAWRVLAAIVVLSLVPPAARPSTVVPHVEHAGVFFLDGAAFFCRPGGPGVSSMEG